LIPYSIALVVVGIPIMILELGLGHKMRGSAPMSFAKVRKENRDWEWLGWWAVICAMYGIMLYYSVILAWCLRYTFFSTTLAWGTDPNDFFFNQFLQISKGPLDFGDIRFGNMFALVAVWGACWTIVYFGVQKGIERANKIFMPLLFCLILVLIVWSLSLKGASQGIAVYLKPNFALLRKPQIWLDAFSQIFFTLSLGFGVMIAYASYLPRKADIVKDALWISVGNCLFSFLAGFAVFGTLGYMSFSTGKPIDAIVKESIGLAFVVYPQAIGLMPAFARTFGVIFFASLVIAGLSSAISIVEAFVSAVIDKFHYSRKGVVTSACISGFLGSLIFTAKSGLYWVDIIDHFVTHYAIVVSAILGCVVVAWILKADKLRHHINNAGVPPLSKFWDIAVRFITPAVLVALLAKDIITELSAPYEGYPWTAIIGIGHHWLGFSLIAALFVAMRPWKKELENNDEE